MRIMIGYDGSESADVALSDLLRAGLPREADALVVSVGDLLVTPPAQGEEVVVQAFASRRVSSGLITAQTQAAHVIKEAKGFALRARDRVRALFPGWDVSAESLIGAPSWELISRADEWKADLVVVGSHGRSAPGRFILGSVSKKVVTDSHSSVRVSRRAPLKNEGIPPRIIVGVDGSVSSEQAVREVGNRVWPDGTEVRIIAVDDGTFPAGLGGILPMITGTITPGNEEVAAGALRMVEWAADELRAIGIQASTAIEKGDPRRVLIEEARKWAADSIFVGSRRFNGAFERFRLGSVSTALVTKAHCSVEVVRTR